MNRIKTVLVTGASGDIGSAIAEKFATLGYNVVLHYNKSEDKAVALCKKLKKINPNVSVERADLCNSSEINKMFDNIEKIYGHLDILINNAGISQIKMLCDVTEKEWQNMFDVNVKSVFLCSKRAYSGMVKNKFGRIINISSIWGVLGGSCEVPYSASKAAIIGFTKALAKELAPSGVTVNCVSPGLIDSKMNGHLSTEELADFLEEVPLMRSGKPEEVAHAVAFLASDESGYITGQTLSVDGGLS